MDKVTQILLDDFKRSNKKRKETLAKRYGFDTPSEYLAFLEGREVELKEEEIKEEFVSVEEPTDIVIAFDTTGSMASYIGAVKKHVESLIPDLFEKTEDLKIKIVAFGDYCDMPAKDSFGKAYQESKLTNDANKLQDFVKRAKNTSGGDGDEFYELVIKKITEETDWRENSNRSILLIGDAPPHDLGYTYSGRIINNQIDWRKECEKAKDLGIKIDTLSIGYTSFYKEVSQITGGIHLEFRSSQKTATLLEGYAYARSKSVASFTAMSSTSAVMDDAELSGAYKQMGELLDE